MNNTSNTNNNEKTDWAKRDVGALWKEKVKIKDIFLDM